jgi:ABC-2 type transport system ATP-binding protein
MGKHVDKEKDRMIEARGLTKYFGPKKAVDSVSFAVEKGEILGFLGPNAAGKSTTMRMITGFLPPSAGTAVIGGCDIGRDPIGARKKIGYLPENAPAYADMSVTDFLSFCAEIRGFSGVGKKTAVNGTIEKCFLAEVRHQTISTLSKGYKQRVCFAQSILHDPEYLILDEPTDGLDPNQKHEVRLMIREMSSEKAIILSTHILDEVDAVCSRAIVIANGSIVADDTPDGLKGRSSLHGAVTITVGTDDTDGLLACIRKTAGVASTDVITTMGGVVQVRVFPEKHNSSIVDGVLSELWSNSFRVTSTVLEQGRLDEVFRMITTGSDGRTSH